MELVIVMIKKKFSLLAPLIIAVIFILPSCAGKNAGKSTEMRFGFTTEPLTLDPLNPGNTAEGRSILFNVFEGLVKTDTAGIMQSCMAESWTIEQNALVYNFKIRENVRFHDGSVLGASDIKYSLDTAAAAGFSGLEQIEKVVIKDEKNISVILKTPDPDFLPYMTIGIVKANSADREKKANGTGPFSIEKYTIQRELVLEKFDNYWKKDIPHLEKVTIVFLADTDALLLALRAGSIDGASITGTLAAQLNHEKFDIIHSYSAAVQLLALNNAHKGLDDIRVRKAINYAVDVKEIIDIAFFGNGTPSGSPVIPGLSAYYESSLDEMYNPNPAAARSLLAEAGYNDGNKFSLEITVPSNFIMHVDTAQVIANQLSKAGIDTSIKLVDWATWLSDVYFGRQYQATIISLDSPVVSPRSFLSRYYSRNSDNFINFNNDDFDMTYNALFTETDDAKRARLYRDAQRIIVSNAASVFIQDMIYYTALRGGAYGGALDYPLYAIDFSSIYGIEKKN